MLIPYKGLSAFVEFSICCFCLVSSLSAISEVFGCVSEFHMFMDIGGFFLQACVQLQQGGYFGKA